MANTNFVVEQNIDLTLNQLLNALLQVLGSDPGSPPQAQIWFNSGGKQVKTYDGTTTQTLAFLSAVVNTITAADTTITVGGSGTAVTVKVAKTLDHTYLTDWTASVEAFSLDQFTAPAGDVSFNNHKLTNLTDATNPQDAVNLRTLLNNVVGLSASEPVSYATFAALPANTYNNGASGVGATLTGNAFGALVVDSIAVTALQSILVKNEVATANNGIYIVTTIGDGSHDYVLTRATDFNQTSNIGSGILIPVEAAAGLTPGANNQSTVWTSLTTAAPTVGTTAISFGLIGSSYTAGTGLTLTGNVFSLTSPVTIALGGTGAASAAAARTNLGAAGIFTSAAFGDGTTTSFVITHNLNNSQPTVDVYRTDGTRVSGFGWVASSANAGTIYFGIAPATNTRIAQVKG